MNRRSFLLGLSSTLAAPAIVRVASLMSVKAIRPTTDREIMMLFEQRCLDASDLMQRQIATMVYGTDELPVIFSGFKPRIEYKPLLINSVFDL